MRDKSLIQETYQKEKLKIHILKTGILALEQMQESADVDQWLFLQKRIEEFQFKLEFSKSLVYNSRKQHPKAFKEKLRP